MSSDKKKGVKRSHDHKDKTDKNEKQPKVNTQVTDYSKINFSCDKECETGKRYSLKIASWNVAGLRACTKKGLVDYIKREDADIVCLQETKCTSEQVPPELKISGYHRYFLSGARVGFDGVALYSKDKPLEIKYGIGNKEFDKEGRVITAEYEQFFVVTAYVVNAGSGLCNLNKRMSWDTAFRDYLLDLDSKKPVILAGDLNVAHEPIDLANPQTNTKSAGFTKEEREGFSKLLESGFVDSFRYFYKEKTGAYTYWTYFRNARSRNTGWRLDYFVVSEKFVKCICDNVIRSEVYGSDHCPIVLYFNPTY